MFFYSLSPGELTFILIMRFQCHLVAITFMNISSEVAFIWQAGEPIDDSSDNLAHLNLRNEIPRHSVEVYLNTDGITLSTENV